jgi:adenylylsulfate kinase
MQKFESSGISYSVIIMSGMTKREGFTLWFTGWSGAGKTTLAIEVEKALRMHGIPYVQRLDGDIVRQDLTRDLGFSREDRDENIRRVTFVAALLSTNGVATLVSFISPYRKARDTARVRCHNFIEIYMKCSPEILMERDVKGLYRKAKEQQIKNFTGIDDPYEEPLHPEIVIDSGKISVKEACDIILAYIRYRHLIG